MPDIEIRRATPADATGVVETSAALFIEDGVERDRLRDPGWPRQHGATWIAELLADPNALVLVAIADGGPGGHLVGQFSPASSMWRAARAELVSMYVAPHLRRQGVGSRLIEAFAAWARERGATRAHVTAYTANEGAVRFYRRHGYLPLSTTLAADL